MASSFDGLPKGKLFEQYFVSILVESMQVDSTPAFICSVHATASISINFFLMFLFDFVIRKGVKWKPCRLAFRLLAD